VAARLCLLGRSGSDDIHNPEKLAAVWQGGRPVKPITPKQRRVYLAKNSGGIQPPLHLGRGYSTRMFPETVLTSSMKPPSPTLPSSSCLPKAPCTVTSRAV